MRKLEGTDFVAAARLRRSGVPSGAWLLGRCELEGDAIVDSTSKVSECVVYKPLEEVPDLFFRFARLYEAEDFATSALEWVRNFGLPKKTFRLDAKKWDLASLAPRTAIGLDPFSGQLELVSEEVWQHRQRYMEGETTDGPCPLWYVPEETQGNRPSMTIKELQEDAGVAWDTLAHYEAYVNREPERVLHLPDGSLHPEYELAVKSRSMDFVRWIIMAGALHIAEGAVTHMVNTHCSFKPSNKEDRQGQGSSRWAWDFHDLRGAMYLQMMWVMERGVTIGRCKWCNNTLSEKGPKGNKSGKKKMFCNNAHRMAYNRARSRLQQ